MPHLSKILLIDDDDDDRYLIVEAFKSNGLGVDISEASNGSDAIELICSMNQDPSLVIVDMNMPVMSGLETIQQIRKWQPDTPVILLTTTLTSELAHDAIKLGATGCFSKPVTFEDMCSLTNQFCRRFLQH